MNQKTFRNLLFVFLLVVISFGTGYKAGTNNIPGLQAKNVNIINTEQGKPQSIDFSLFWDVWDRLNRLYIDKKALDSTKMVYGAVSGMVASLGDPYTVFLPPEQNKEAENDLGGKFEGIGAQLGVKDNKIVVIAPLKGSPAEAVGLKPGDWILKVDGKETLNWTLPEAVSKIRGAKGSKVTLTVEKKDSSNSSDLTVVRDEIKVASVEWEVKNQVIHLKLSRFGDNTDAEWNDAVMKIKEKLDGSGTDKPKGIILDLRNNPGGYLTGSVFIASEFLSDGTVVLQESASGVKQTYSVNRKGRLLNVPLVVLINKGSASAAEIVAGALSDRGRAKLIGETTFGKGSIQEPQDLPNGAGIHITIAKWLLPSGKWINGTGIEPDIKVLPDETNPDKDIQLEKAIEYFVK